MSIDLPKSSYPIANCDKKFLHDEHSFVEGTIYIFRYLRKQERKFIITSDYITRQSWKSTKVREIIIDWLTEIHERLDLREETLFLCVNILDRYLELTSVDKDALQLVGAACLFIASKMEETLFPTTGDLAHLSKQSFSREAIVDMEMKIVKKLEFRLTLPYSLTFARRYLRVSNASRFERRYSEYLLGMSLMDYTMAFVLPSKLAAASVLIALRFKNPYINDQWPKLLQTHTGYSCRELKPLASSFIDLVHKNSSRSKAVYRKFSRAKYGEIAKIPLQTLMNNSLRLNKLIENLKTTPKPESLKKTEISNLLSQRHLMKCDQDDKENCGDAKIGQMLNVKEKTPKNSEIKKNKTLFFGKSPERANLAKSKKKNDFGEAKPGVVKKVKRGLSVMSGNRK